MNESADYLVFVGELKAQIIRSRYQAARLVNRELVLLYFLIGKRLSEKVAAENWGTKVIEQISIDLQRAMPGLRGFSYRNMRNMRQFAEEYKTSESLIFTQVPDNQGITIWQLATAKLEIESEVFLSLGFTHHLVLLNRCKNLDERFFYMKNSVDQHWTIDLLDHQISAKLFEKQGKLPNNFAETMPENLRNQALLAFKDEYLLDFIHIDPEDERILEKNIVDNIRRFILTIGKGFAFIGNQFRIEVDGEEYFIDLLFYNRILQCLVSVELKRGKFKPEFPGKLSFYLNVLNETMRLPHENPSIGIILCKEKSDNLVKFAVRGIENPIGVATYRFDNEMPADLKNVLPDAEKLKDLLG
jgi:predicted nuclease of restriction endonuclease-like (RecB) superfamily